MSALAKLLKSQGHKVSGSDSTESAQTRDLEENKIKVYYSPNFNEVKKADAIVVSSAIHDDNLELIYAKYYKKKIITRGQLLGQISSQYHHVISVSGAHGKTTTTALLSKIFSEAGLNPTVHIGGLLCENNANVIIGGRDYFITEACEYKDNFLSLHSDMGIILNAEAEHLDYFKTFSGVKKSFLKFASQSNNLINLSKILPKNLVFSHKKYSESIKGISFDCYKNGQFYAHVKCGLHGKHNVQNILVAIQCADYYGIKSDTITKALVSFQGVKRRFEKHSFYNGSTLVFDYAHHPTEIKKTLSVIQKLCKGQLIVIFQPHTYSRTKAFFADFVDCFKNLQNVIIFQTYSAREDYDQKGDARTLATALARYTNCTYSEDYNILKSLTKLSSVDCVLVLGAGDFYDKCNF